MVINTIAHEILHTACIKDGHGRKFIEYGKRMLKMNPGYYIKELYLTESSFVNYNIDFQDLSPLDNNKTQEVKKE